MTQAPVVAAAATNTDAPATESAPVPTEALAVGAAATNTTVRTDAPTEAATEAGPAATRTPRLHLEATDPGTVTLAAGRPQLVEFFAFW